RHLHSFPTRRSSDLAKTDFPLDRLTRRERQVLQLIAEGKKTKEIAALLGVKIKTAETHRTRIMRRVNIHETANLVRYAIRGGLRSEEHTSELQSRFE